MLFLLTGSKYPPINHPSSITTAHENSVWIIWHCLNHHTWPIAICSHGTWRCFFCAEKHIRYCSIFWSYLPNAAVNSTKPSYPRSITRLPMILSLMNDLVWTKAIFMVSHSHDRLRCLFCISEIHRWCFFSYFES